MLSIKFIQENKLALKNDLKKRQEDEKIKWVDDILEYDSKYKKLLQDSQKLRHERNNVTAEINEMKKSGKDISKKIKEVKEIPEKIKKAEEKLEEIKEKMNYILHRLPLITHESVPVGASEEDNVVVKTVGKPTELAFKPKSHIELGESLDIINIEKAAKTSGSRFYYLKNELVLMEFALVRYVFDIIIKEGFTPIIPPVLVREKVLFGTGFLPTGRDSIYKIEGEDLMLVGTAEAPLGAMHMDELFKKDELPKHYAGFSSCFRTEAGSHGKDTKGIFRVHQFDKIEMFKFCLPEHSWKEFNHLIRTAEKIYKGLELPYQITNVCTGDLGYVAKKYDLEVWLPAQGKYREAVSCSNCLDYQSRRLNIRYEDEKRAYVHTLNSTACAIARTLVAILENYQNKDGSVNVPKALIKYMGIKKIVRKNG